MRRRRPPGRVGPVADLDVDEGKVAAQLVLGRDAVRTGVDLGHVHDGQQGVSLLRLDLEVTAGLDAVALSHPSDARLGVAGERNLDDAVLALVEEGRITEPGGGKRKFNKKISKQNR